MVGSSQGIPGASRAWNENDKYMRKLLLTCLWFAVTLGTAYGDVIFNDSKRVQHVVRIENLKEFTNHVLYLHSPALVRARTSGALEVKETGVAISRINPLAFGKDGLRL
jgi:hypothetical protein